MLLISLFALLSLLKELGLGLMIANER